MGGCQNCGVILGLYWGLYRGYIGVISELHWGYIGVILGLYRDYVWGYVGGCQKYGPFLDP